MIIGATIFNTEKSISVQVDSPHTVLQHMAKPALGLATLLKGDGVLTSNAGITPSSRVKTLEYWSDKICDFSSLVT
jgi:hypothetical protein